MLLGVTVVCLSLAGSAGVPNAAVMAAIAVAAALSSIGGLAFSAICGAALFHLDIDPIQAVEIMMLCSIANQATMVWALRYAIDWRDLAVFLMGGTVGLPVGIWLLLHADRGAYTHAFGVFLLLYLREGFGWCNMPMHLVADLIAQGGLRRLSVREQSGFTIPLQAVHLQDRRPSRAGRKLVELLRSELADSLSMTEKSRTVWRRALSGDRPAHDR